MVTLGPLAGPALVLPAVRQALELHESRHRSALETVAAHCQGRRLLLVLDNFEHVMGAAPELAGLLARCPGQRALVTSRAPLRLRAEHELPVPPLRLPEAGEERDDDLRALGQVPSVRLFVERAGVAVPGFRLSRDNAAAIAAICRRLGGLPLALELAARWVRLLPPQALLARLDRGLELLVDGPRDLPERQRTMRAALSWSRALLDEGATAVLRRLSVFAGSAPLDAVERVCQAAGAIPGGALRQLAVVLDHGLVQRLDVPEGPPRVTMLASVREYAGELLIEAGELEGTALAHLEHYAELATRARGELRAAGQAAWLARLRSEHDNLRAALAWAARTDRTDLGLRLATALWLFWDYGGHRQEGLSWLERQLAAGRPVDARLRAEALHGAGFLAWQLGAYELSHERQRESLAIFRELGDVRSVANALRGLGEAAGGLGRRDEAIRLLDEAVSLLRELGDRPLLAVALVNLGAHVARRPGPGRATALFEEALAIQRDLDSPLGVALCLVNLADRAREHGDLELARARLEEAVAIARRLDAPFHLAAALANLGDLAYSRGDVAGVRARYRESLRLFAAVGDPQAAAHCLRWLAWVAWREGRPECAARLFGAAGRQGPVEIAPDGERLLHERTRAALRDQLGDESATAAFEAGGRLSLEAATAEAVGVGRPQGPGGC